MTIYVAMFEQRISQYIYTSNYMCALHAAEAEYIKLTILVSLLVMFESIVKQDM